MGASNVSGIIKAKDQSELKKKFQELCQNDREENGSSYSGSWGMKHSVKVITSKHTDEDEILEELEEKADKWGDALAVKLPGDRYIVTACCSS